MRCLLGFLGAAAWVLCSSGLSAAQLDGKPVPIHRISAKHCKECHQDIYRQWKGSMHAQSTALSDPIHGAFYRMVVGDPTQEGVTKGGKYPVCLKCHAPNAARDGTTKLDAAPAYAEGVNCVACHTLGTYHGIQGPEGKMRLGIDTWTLSDTLLGPNGFFHEQGEAAQRLRVEYEESGDLNPHLGRDNQGKPYMSEEDVQDLDLPLAPNPEMKTAAACLGCHDRRNNPHGVSLCQTGDEYLEGGSRETCQSCHMPVAGGVVNHAMGGGHDLAMLRRAVKLNLHAQSQGNQLQVEVVLENLQPHNVPTGAPFRNAYLKLSALDASGKVLWTNFQVHPAKEDPQAFLVYTLLNDQDQPAPPPKATKPGMDTRLKPFERRTLSYHLPAEGVDSLRAELYYNLLWPALVKKLKHLPEALKQPKRMAWQELKL